jgi:hypothetical protein
MIQLKDITLVCVTSIRIKESVKSMLYSSKDIEFAKLKLITSEDIIVDSKIEVERCRKLTSLQDYSQFMIYDLYKHIDTEFCLIVQHDGKVNNSNLWNPKFLSYDYIGAPWVSFKNTFWPWSNCRYFDYKWNEVSTDNDDLRVGNGGFSLRSKRLLESSKYINTPFLSETKRIDNTFYVPHEDFFISIYARELYENQGVKYCPFELACHFSKESIFEENKNIQTFGSHRQ